jgi:hypothetical protein
MNIINIYIFLLICCLNSQRQLFEFEGILGIKHYHNQIVGLAHGKRNLLKMQFLNNISF